MVSKLKSDPEKKIFDEGYKQGIEVGRGEAFAEIFTHLEKKYMSPSTTPKTPEAEAILEVTRELGKLLRKKQKKTRKR